MKLKQKKYFTFHVTNALYQKLTLNLFAKKVFGHSNTNIVTIVVSLPFQTIHFILLVPLNQNIYFHIPLAFLFLDSSSTWVPES